MTRSLFGPDFEPPLRPDELVSAPRSRRRRGARVPLAVAFHGPKAVAPLKHGFAPWLSSKEETLC